MVGSLTGRLASMAESAYPLDLSPIPRACASIRATGGGAGALAPILVPPGECLNTSAVCVTEDGAHLCNAAARPHSATLDRAGTPRPPRPPRPLGNASTAGDAWFYLACTEIVHPIAANNATDMFPPQSWTLEGLEDTCRARFGVSPRPQWLPSSFGMARGIGGLARTTSHVIFTNGLLDPWSSQSVTADASATLVAINLPDGSHHSDLGAPPNPTISPDDSPSLRAARAQQLQLLRQWLGSLGEWNDA
jgi:hypothetical protein